MPLYELPNGVHVWESPINPKPRVLDEPANQLFHWHCEDCAETSQIGYWTPTRAVIALGEHEWSTHGVPLSPLDINPTGG